MKKKILLIMIFGFILFGCGKPTNIHVVSMGEPYLIKGEELCKKQHLESEEWCSNNFYFDDVFLKDRNLKKEVIAVPIETSFDMIENAGYFLRECSFTEEITQNSKHGFDITVFPFDRANYKKGFFILNIDKVKKLGWLDKDNLLTKSICVSPFWGYKDKGKEINSVALKNALDKLESQEK